MGKDLTESRNFAGVFDVLIIIQPGPLIDSVDGRLVLLQVVLGWLPIFVVVPDVGVLSGQPPETGQIFVFTAVAICPCCI